MRSKLPLLACLIYIAYQPYSWSFFSSESKCSKLKWAQEDSRTQGGGWIWFPGKGTADTLELAYLKAEGIAIERLMQECNFPHKEIKIHERCDEQVGKYYRAFIRLSLLDKQCQETKYAKEATKKIILNQQLASVHQRYQEFLRRENKLPMDNCSPKAIQNCHHLGRYEFQMGNFQKAFFYFDTACRSQNKDSCFNAGLTASQLGQDKQALALFKLACNDTKANPDAIACLFVGKTYEQIGKSNNSRKYYRKSCQLGQGEACFLLGELYRQQNSLSQAETYYTQACGSNYKQACFETSKIYFDQKNLTLAKKFAQLGCELNHQKSCYNLGYLLLQSSSKDSDKDSSKDNQQKALAVEAFSKACKLDLGIGCWQAAKAAKRPKSELYSKACDLGVAEACQDLASQLFDQGKKQESLEYARIGCKLGLLKSCHNAGFLLFGQGQFQQSKLLFNQSCQQGLNASCAFLKKHARRFSNM